MTIFNPTGLTTQQIIGNVQNILRAHRDALEACHDLFRWSSGIAPADLQAVGFSAADAATLLSAIADANAEYVLYNTGLPPASYPQPPQPYQYAASQSEVIGPQ